MCAPDAVYERLSIDTSKGTGDGGANGRGGELQRMPQKLPAEGSSALTTGGPYSVNCKPLDEKSCELAATSSVTLAADDKERSCATVGGDTQSSVEFSPAPAYVACTTSAPKRQRHECAAASRPAPASSPAPASRPAPKSRTSVPPAVGPASGITRLTVGPA